MSSPTQPNWPRAAWYLLIPACIAIFAAALTAAGAVNDQRTARVWQPEPGRIVSLPHIVAAGTVVAAVAPLGPRGRSTRGRYEMVVDGQARLGDPVTIWRAAGTGTLWRRTGSATSPRPRDDWQWFFIALELATAGLWVTLAVGAAQRERREYRQTLARQAARARHEAQRVEECRASAGPII